MSFRRCTADDIPLLRKLAEKTYRDTFERFNSAEDMEKYIETAMAHKKLESEIQNSASVFYFAESDGKAAGYMKLNFAPAQTELNDDDSLEIERLYLLREFHGKGYGAVMMEKAVSIARENGKAYIWLGVWEHNEKALAFYKRNGFYRIGEHPYVLGDDVQTDFLMRKDL